MKQSFLILCLFLFAPLLLAGAAPQGGQESREMNVFQAFSHDGVLYTYIDAPDVGEETLSISARIGDHTYPRLNPVTTAEKAAVPSYFIILADTSGSMSPFRSQIEEFVNSFLETAPDGAQFLLAPFGETFSPRDGFTDKKDEIKTALAGLTYQDKKTSLYTCICEAADYFGERTAGELHQIIAITDGIEADKSGVTAEEVKDKLSSMPVAVHTFGLFNQNGPDTAAAKEALKVLGSFARVSKGLHNVLGYDKRSAAELAAEIPAYCSRLYVADFDTSGFRSAGREYNVILTLRDGNKPLGELECMVKIPLAPNFPDEGGGLNPFVTEAPSEETTPEASPEQDTLEAAPEPNVPESSPGQDLTGPSPEPEPSGSADPPEDPDVTAGDAEKNRRFRWLYLSAAAAAVLLTAAVIFLLLRKTKKRKRRAHSDIPPFVPDGIFIRLEVIHGNYCGNNFEFYLKDELVIGRDRKCDLVFKDRDVSGRNSRVFLHDNALYLEDLGSRNGTAISDMRIHTQNRLRSGDVISIGSVYFTLKF